MKYSPIYKRFLRKWRKVYQTCDAEDKITVIMNFNDAWKYQFPTQCYKDRRYASVVLSVKNR